MLWEFVLSEENMFAITRIIASTDNATAMIIIFSCFFCKGIPFKMLAAYYLRVLYPLMFQFNCYDMAMQMATRRHLRTSNLAQSRSQLIEHTLLQKYGCITQIPFKLMNFGTVCSEPMQSHILDNC